MTSKLLNTFTTYKTVYVTPTGQPKLGYIGGSRGGNVKFTAQTGKSVSRGSGYGDKVPSKPGNYKFQFIKKYTIKTQKIAIYKYGTYQYTTYSHSPSYALGHRWIKI